MNVVMMSSGTASAVAGKRVAERYGPHNTILLFADVNGEDRDNYRFLLEAWEWIDAPMVILDNGGRTIWDVFRDSRFLGNSHKDLCSRQLKREVMRAWLETHWNPQTTTVHLGYDVDEEQRFQKAQPHWEPWAVQAPMCWNPPMFKHEGWEWLAEAGIELPRLTRDGYSHANCGGMCVRMGHTQAKQTLLNDPATYAEWEANEEAIRQHLGKDVAILKDRRGGTTKPLTLRSLRLRVEADDGQVASDDWGSCNCVSGWDDDQPATYQEPSTITDPTEIRLYLTRKAVG